MSVKAPQDLMTDFWQWALGQWKRPDVEALLLALQDRRGVIIMEVLLAAFLAFRGTSIRREQWRSVVAVGAPWVTEVVLPLRALRRRWKKDQDEPGLRAHLQRLELAAEKSLAVLYIGALEAEMEADSMVGDGAKRHGVNGDVNRETLLANLAVAAADQGVEAHELERLAVLMVET